MIDNIVLCSHYIDEVERTSQSTQVILRHQLENVATNEAPWHHIDRTDRLAFGRRLTKSQKLVRDPSAATYKADGLTFEGKWTDETYWSEENQFCPSTVQINI